MIASINGLTQNVQHKYDKNIEQAYKVINEEFSNTQFSRKVWRKIDNFFDFGSSKGLNFNDFSKQELEQYLSTMSKLLKKGIIGWKYYEVNGQIEKHFIVTSIGDQRLSNAIPKKWNKPNEYF